MVNHTYTYGHDLISQDQFDNGTSAWRASFYGYDGRGTVRFLTDETGAVTDTYTYDAFGTLITATGSTNNRYLYSGEQFDPNLGLYYLRARLMNPLTGRFWTQDSYEGQNLDPASLHKYLYANADPANLNDPTGFTSSGNTEQSFVSSISASIARFATQAALRTLNRASFELVRTQALLPKLLLRLEIISAGAGLVFIAADALDNMAAHLLDNVEPISDHWATRGRQVERIAGGNLNGNVNIIDDLTPDGVGTSIKSRGLGGGVDDYIDALERDVKAVAKAPDTRIYGKTAGGATLNLPPGTVKQPSLLFAVPENHASVVLHPRFRSCP